MIYDESLGPPQSATLVDPHDGNRQKQLPPEATYADLLVPVVRGGRPVYDPPPPAEARLQARGTRTGAVVAERQPRAEPARISRRPRSQRLRFRPQDAIDPPGLAA